MLVIKVPSSCDQRKEKRKTNMPKMSKTYPQEAYCQGKVRKFKRKRRTSAGTHEDRKNRERVFFWKEVGAMREKVMLTRGREG